jgi:hypothetical protein
MTLDVLPTDKSGGFCKHRLRDTGASCFAVSFDTPQAIRAHPALPNLFADKFRTRFYPTNFWSERPIICFQGPTRGLRTSSSPADSFDTCTAKQAQFPACGGAAFIPRRKCRGFTPHLVIRHLPQRLVGRFGHHAGKPILDVLPALKDGDSFAIHAAAQSALRRRCAL